MWTQLQGTLSDQTIRQILGESASVSDAREGGDFVYAGTQFFYTIAGIRLLHDVQLELDSHLDLTSLFKKPAIHHAYLLYKSPGGAATKLHQDRPYWEDIEADVTMFTTWIALDDVPRERGCLLFSPDTFVTAANLKAFNSNQDTYPHVLEVEPTGTRRVIRHDISGNLAKVMVPVPLTKGAVVAFDAFEPHGALPNSSARPRLAMKIVYGEADSLHDFMITVDDLRRRRFHGFQLKQLKQTARHAAARLAKTVVSGLGYNVVRQVTGTPVTQLPSLEAFERKGTIPEWRQATMYSHVVEKTRHVPGDIVAFGIEDGTSLMALTRIVEVFNSHWPDPICKKKVYAFDTSSGSSAVRHALESFCEQHRTCELRTGTPQDTVPEFLDRRPHISFSVVQIRCAVTDYNLESLLKCIRRLNVGGILLFGDGLHESSPIETVRGICERIARQVPVRLQEIESLPWKWYGVREA